jgi:hypothetical protein
MRIARGLRARAAGAGAPPRYDSWLETFHGDRLRAIDDASAGGAPECFALFRDLDTELWALLLTKEYDAYPNIRALLPDMPDPSLQELWRCDPAQMILDVCEQTRVPATLRRSEFVPERLPFDEPRWAPLFELLDVDLLIDDLHQVMLTLRRR